MPVAKKNDTFYTHEWCSKVDIDYFTAFVKVYIPFNSWMNEHIQGDTDRSKINRMKESADKPKSKIVALLQADGQNGETFRNELGALHTALENAVLYNNREQISFQNVYIEPNKDHDKETSHYGVVFHAHYDENNRKTTLTIRNRKGDAITTLKFDGYPTKEEVSSNSKFASLCQERKDMLLPLYQQVNPRVMDSLLTNDESKCILCGAIKMTDDTSKLAAGIIEILYNLRNALFHGIIDPNKDANQVYGAAYQVMYPLIQSLV